MSIRTPSARNHDMDLNGKIMLITGASSGIRFTVSRTQWLQYLE